MRRIEQTSLLLLLLLSGGCRSPWIQLEIERKPGVRSMLIVLERGATPLATQNPSSSELEMIAIGPSDEGAELLPSIQSDDPLEQLRVLRFDFRESLEQLGFSAGRLPPLGTLGGRPIPPWQRVEINQSDRHRASGWHALDPSEPDPSRLRIPAHCPTSTAPLPVGAITQPSGCPLQGPPRGAICYGAPVRWAFAPTPETAVASVQEDWLYYSSSVKFSGQTRLTRIRLQTATVSERGSAEDLPAIPVPLGDPHQGWSKHPEVRSDGLELFFTGTWPQGEPGYDKLLISHRASTDAAWSEAIPIVSLAHPEVATTTVWRRAEAWAQLNPLLLPDYRTLLFWDNFVGQIQTAHRGSTEPGDTAFGLDGVAEMDVQGPGIQIQGLTLSCDRRHVIYSYRSDLNGVLLFELRMVELASLNPLRFGPPELLATLEQPPVRAQVALWAVEAKDCRVLYLSDDFTSFWAPRRACQ